MNNQTITEVSRVTFISGVAKVRTPDGELHDLKIGDILQPGSEVILADASVFVVEATAPEATGAQMPAEAVAAGDLPAGQQPSGPEMGSADDQTLAQINQLQQAILAGADPTQAFEAAAAGVAADAGGRGPGSGNSGFISVDRIGDETIATAGYDTGAQGAAPVIQADEPAALIPEEENRPTIVAPDTNTVKEDTPATGNVLANDSDPDDGLSVVSFVVNGETYTAGSEVVLPGIGTLVINADGSYVFNPNDNWNGSVPEVTYTTNTQASSTLNITVEPVNDIPVAIDNYYSLDEGGSVTSNLITADANGSAAGGVDYDVDGDTLTVTAVNGVPLVFDSTGKAIVAVDHGTLEIHSDGTFTYTHDGTQPVVPTSFTYTITDGQGASSISTANVGMDVNNVNDPPVAVNNYYYLDEGDSVSGNVITDDANGATAGGVDYDLDGDTLTITAINGEPVSFDDTGKAFVAVDYGVLEIHSDGSFTYTHDGSQPVIPISFTYTITDGHGESSISTANVGMEVDNVNDKPVAVNDSNSVAEDASVGRAADFGVLSNDTDADGDTLTVTAVRTGPEGGSGTTGTVGNALTGTYGTLTLNADGSYSYAADQAAADALATGQSATDIFTYTIDDGQGGTDTAQLVITVTGTNDGPKFEDEGTDDTGAVTEDLNPVDGHLSDSGIIIFDDADLLDTHSVSVAKTGGALGGTLAAAITDPATGEGTGTISWTYTVNNSATQFLAVGQTVMETFAVTINDGHGGTATQVVTVTITGTNDAPTITAALTDASGAVTEDATTPTLNDSGTITFDDIDLIDVHTVSVAKTGGTLGGSLVASVSDPATGAGDGTVSWTYSVANSATQYLALGQTTTESFTVTISDGHGGTVVQPVTVTITGTNDIPTISAAVATGDVTEDATTPTLSDSGTITFDDIDLIDVHSATVVKSSGTLGGSLAVSVSDPATGAGDGTVGWTYTVANSATQYLALGQTTTESFTVTINDGQGGTVDQLITVTITGTNDAPVISAAVDSGSVTADVDPVEGYLSDTGTITFDDIDLQDGHSISVTSAAGNTLGGSLGATLTDPATGAGDGTITWVYTVANSATQYLAHGQTITESFTVLIDDGNGGTTSQVITITITGANEAPTISAAVATGDVTEDATTPTLTDSGTITFDDIDLTDVHSTSVVKNSGTLGGSLVASVTDPATGAGDGTVSWTYSVANSATQYLALGQTTTETFTVTISDGQGGTVDQLITVTITGTNDAPTISAAVATGDVTEDATTPNLTDSGTITFDDIDLIDVHSTTVVKNSGTLGGSLVASVTDPATDAGDGTVSWTYTVANSATQYLALGQTTTETFTVTISDGQGGTVDQLITVTITGTNDAPTISAAVATGDVTEDATTPTLTDSGTITFDDIDLIDVHSATVVKNSGTLGGSLVASVTDPATDAGDGTVSWTYTVANSATQYLALGQTTTETFTVTINDGNGGTVDQLITVTITGTNDAPTISAAVATGDVTEDATTPTLSDTGTITFDDIDLSDVHTVSVAKNSGTLGGSLVATVTDPATDAGDGSVSWTYTVANSATQYLALGQTTTETFTVTISDGQGGTVDQLITVTITGTNDAPTISAAVATGDVTEDATTPTLSDSGTITFDDIDLIDVHSASVVKNSGTLGGSLVATVTDPATDAGDGTVSWTYTVANSATQYLALGQTTTETFTVTISDGNGGTVDQLITVTITGTNDAPTISAAVATGDVTEDATTPTLSDTGSITFDDIDLMDVHSASVVKNSGTLGGSLVASVTDPATDAGDGTVSWTYSVANSATQYLAAGQTTTETFTVTINDGNGGTVDQLITVTITGTNDAPTISAAVATGDVTEDATTPTLSDSGTITFDDIDLSDVHTVSVVKNSGTLGGSLVATVTDPATDAGDGTMSWTYSVANSATQYLALGQTTTETFTVTISDGNGGTVDQLITVTITGTNDAPTISAAVATGDVTEDATTPTLSDTGSITFDDIDLMDVHSASVVKNSGTLGGSLVATVTDPATDAGDGSVSWTYTVANSATQYLALGQTTTETFTVTISDGQGGTVDQLITVTITGTNDAPTISAAVATGDVTEDATTPTLSDSGTITFDDIDLIDVHSASVVKNSGTLGGSLVATVTDPATDAGDGTMSWTYSVANSATQYLALGQTTTETFTVTISDGQGGTVDQLITVTITGTNDAPTITAGSTDAIGAVTEDATSPNLTDSGTITFSDIDLIDTHTTSVTPVAGNTLGGTLTLGAVSEAASTEPGTVT